MRDLQTESKKEGTNSYMELKNRIVIISEKNMNNINALYGKCITDELERVVNNMINNAVVEINEDRIDEMGKLSVGDALGICPVWYPLRCKIDDSSATR